MQQNRTTILSTRPLEKFLLNVVKEKGIDIDVVSFIETKPIRLDETKTAIEQALSSTASVVFTSTNAVKAVSARMNENKPDWKIFCIGNTTRRLVEKYFGNSCIEGIAANAETLAQVILDKKNTRKIIFFCGGLRRNELPDKLRKNDINVKEIVVYQTILTPHPVTKNYDAVLFFSPGGVESFFKKNKPEVKTILFAIGNTTANEIKNYSNNRIVIADEPGKENLVYKAIEFFTT